MNSSHLTGVKVWRRFHPGQSDVISVETPVHVSLVSDTPVKTVQLLVVVQKHRGLLKLLAVSPAKQLPDISHKPAGQSHPTSQVYVSLIT